VVREKGPARARLNTVIAASLSLSSDENGSWRWGMASENAALGGAAFSFADYAAAPYAPMSWSICLRSSSSGVASQRLS
jgi:hypothetical protein